MEELVKKTILYNLKKLPNENKKIKPYCLSVESLSQLCWWKKSIIKKTLDFMKVNRLVEFTFPAGLACLTPEGIKAMNQLTVDDFKLVEAERLKRSFEHMGAKEKYALSNGVDPKTMEYGFDEKFTD